MPRRFDRTNYANNLPDAYNKRSGSNNVKILSIEKRTLDGFLEELADVYNSLDLDVATGKTLDLYGEMVGQARGMASDEQYRVMIKSRILRNMTNGDYNSIARAVSLIFSCDPTEFKLTEEKPCVVKLEGLPYEMLNSSGVDLNDAISIIAEVMPVGVRLESIFADGTFAFAASATEYDETAGFGISNDDQTIGGSLGLLAGSGNSNLPI